MAAAHWQLRVCGINHRTADVAQREPLQLRQDELARAHADFVGQHGVLEATIVSTCNRVEFYFVGRCADDPFDIVSRFYREWKRLDLTFLRNRFYCHKGQHAAGHLFRVAAGIDSMVLGEDQILGQLKTAYSSSCGVKTAGKIIHRLFHHAFRVGKQVRSDTEMGRGACSVSSAAMKLLRERLGKDARPDLLFVGAGPMIELAANAWSKLHHDRMTFVNRTPARVGQLARRYGGTHHGLDGLPAALDRASLVITSTGAPEAIITAEMLDRRVATSPGRELTIMDLAVPRDVDSDPERHPGVTVLDLGDVQEFVRERQRDREAAIPEVERIVEQRLSEFVYWYEHARHEFVYEGLGEACEDLRHRELDAVLAKLPEEQRLLVERATTSLVERLVELKIREANDAEPSKCTKCLAGYSTRSASG